MSERDLILDEVARAYAGLERPESFRDPDAIERYRASLLRRSTGQADFLSRRLRPPARALELACGNGRLIMELARRGALSSATGTDIAASRIAFAASWAEDLGLPSLRFATEDVLATRASGDCDLTSCITGALGYSQPAGAR